MTVMYGKSLVEEFDAGETAYWVKRLDTNMDSLPFAVENAFARALDEIARLRVEVRGLQRGWATETIVTQK